MSRQHPPPLDEAVVRALLACEAERVTPRPDARDRFLATIAAQGIQETQRRGSLGGWRRSRGLRGSVGERGVRVALAVVAVLLVLFSAVGRPVAATVMGEIRDAARCVVGQRQDVRDGSGTITTVVPAATRAATPATTVLAAPTPFAVSPASPRTMGTSIPTPSAGMLAIPGSPAFGTPSPGSPSTGTAGVDCTPATRPSVKSTSPETR